MFCNLTPRAVNLMIGQRDPHQPHTRVISEIFSAIEKLERWALGLCFRPRVNLNSSTPSDQVCTDNAAIRESIANSTSQAGQLVKPGQARSTQMEHKQSRYCPFWYAFSSFCNVA
ncbi:uncharacterized protein PGTG_15301 [Puccinia graminis f. sp. tritici CRL 75-36-700-3]|uniref:Uncharacterized protein n=1 Tax=Puccinia graminis f. sp. tritici (strain CRL 75-36-700-3 / race SCCL) TaxID=418459 RepID=E3KYR3_PUCGT|nr:uncharacterized protein PGTG_15301 [Puccinia graminis f. sp. tritici CRL 75-36-700-3]EFP89459.1 hypothetical protein PGTG_15301 [Puccinia graminis f. sp. tritici CRL 75-36-700-3]